MFGELSHRPTCRLTVSVTTATPTPGKLQFLLCQRRAGPTAAETAAAGERHPRAGLKTLRGCCAGGARERSRPRRAAAFWAGRPAPGRRRPPA